MDDISRHTLVCAAAGYSCHSQHYQRCHYSLCTMGDRAPRYASRAAMRAAHGRQPRRHGGVTSPVPRARQRVEGVGQPRRPILVAQVGLR